MSIPIITGSYLTTSSQVKSVAYGRSVGIDVATSDITSAIEDAEAEIFSAQSPSVNVQFWIDSTHTDYEYRKTRAQTYKIALLAIWSPDNNSRRDLANSDVTIDLTTNKITISSAQATGWASSYMHVDYIPKEWNILAKNKAALNLLDGDMAQINPGDGNADNPRVSRIAKRINRIESYIKPMVAVGSFENRGFDPRNRPIITQDRFQTNPINGIRGYPYGSSFYPDDWYSNPGYYFNNDYPY